MRERRGNPATPSAFANWVFEQMHPDHQRVAKNASDTRFRWSGKYEHQQIERLRLWMREDHVARSWAVPEEPWRLVYADPPDEKDRRLFTASALRVGGEPMRGHPDVVLRNDRRDTVLILERKVIHDIEGRWEQLRQGYLNNWCQLWCYAWIDDWVHASQVMMVLQYRCRSLGKGGYSEPLDVVPMRFRCNARFHTEMLKQFEAYTGQFALHSPPSPMSRSSCQAPTED